VSGKGLVGGLVSLALIGSAWTWLDSRTVVFRPRAFWPAHTTIRLVANLAEVPVTTTSRIRYDLGNQVSSFNVSRSFVTLIHAKRHRMTVLADGVRVANFGVSFGMPTYQKRSGIKISSCEK
jgi:hypothetical protein